jgi:hypothetical protein
VSVSPNRFALVHPALPLRLFGVLVEDPPLVAPGEAPVRPLRFACSRAPMLSVVEFCGALEQRPCLAQSVGSPSPSRVGSARSANRERALLT